MKAVRNLFGVALLAAVVVIAFLYLPKQGTASRGGGHGHGGEQHSEHGNEVALSDSKVAAAGIELLTASPATLRNTLQLNGIIQPNGETIVQVSPRFPGVARQVQKRVGDMVSANDVLARVESNQSLTVYDLKAPIAGTIIDRQVALGEYVTEQKAAFTIADLSTVWIDLSIHRRDMQRVKLNDRVLIDLGDGGEPIESKVSYVSPVGSADTQSSLARITVDNKDMRLRPGLFVTARLILKTQPASVAVRLSALQTIENRTVVFVREGDKFQIRDVELGDRDAESVEVLFGVSEGEQYAAKNSFIVKAELAKGSATHEH